MKDERIGRASPTIGRKDVRQLLLDNLGLVRLRDANSIGHPQDVSIDGQARNAERVTEHDICRFSANTRQLDQELHARGYFAVVFLDQPARHSKEGL